jgi:hypothetical protein
VYLLITVNLIHNNTNLSFYSLPYLLTFCIAILLWFFFFLLYSFFNWFLLNSYIYFLFNNSSSKLISLFTLSLFYTNLFFHCTYAHPLSFSFFLFWQLVNVGYVTVSSFVYWKRKKWGHKSRPILRPIYETWILKLYATRNTYPL